ncbi:MAG: ATP-binding protein [Nitrospiraceae bacterium]|nr:ATP-binding protein [Nitrospiraceae bacterium]
MIRNYFLNLSLNRKLVLMMLFLSFILLSTLFFIYLQDEKVMINKVESHTAELSKAIQIGVEEVTQSGTTDESRLKGYLKGLKSKGINEISIIGNNDEIIASSNPKKVGAAVSPRRKELIIKAELGDPLSKEGKTYNVILPVKAGKSHYGYIHLTINEDDFSELLKQNTIKRVAAALMVFLIGIAIAVFLATRYTRPINGLIEAAGKVAAGDFEQNLPVDRKDEIGSLTRSFNQMVQRLKENRRLEERLREAEHLSAVGQLSRSMAHEIRNPLNFISLSIDYMKSNYGPRDGDSEKFNSLVSSIKHEIFRLDNLVKDFLDYGKPLRLNTRLVNMRGLLDELFQIVKARADAQKIHIETRYDYMPEVLIDTDFMKTCIYNIILNAFQAMPGGGTLRLKTGKKDQTLVLSISDTGQGVPEENLSKVFEPFFTTKNSGLGLGLATTKRIVEEHGGKIFFESVPGQGSTITMSIPLPDPAIAGLGPAATGFRK